MKKEKNLSEFMARLQSTGLEKVNKHVNAFCNLRYYRKNQEAQLGLHAGHIKMAELRDLRGKRVLNMYQLMTLLTSGKHIETVIYPKLDLKLNLVGRGVELPPAKKSSKKLRPIGKITVWQEPDKNAQPCLTLEQIITQIPQGLVGSTKAVCLLSNEKDLFEDAYNIYMECFQYDVWLLG
ncbi:MAG: hypothetical protein IJ099_04300 [Alphaproteobacteria bacterium]|nr:hypothetical protein [Alphaproteobacteria bacterium]